MDTDFIRKTLLDNNVDLERFPEATDMVINHMKGHAFWHETDDAFTAAINLVVDFYLLTKEDNHQ